MKWSDKIPNHYVMLSDEDLLKLWRDPSLSGSYRGARTFQVLLKTDLNIDVPLSRIYKILAVDQIYLLHKRPIKKFERRKYIVHNYGELCQMDIAHMFTHEETNFRYFLLLVDVFSSKIFTIPLKSRDVEEVIKALKKIIYQFKAPIYEIQADRESAFISKEFKNFLKKENIVYRPKFGKNKGMFTLGWMKYGCQMKYKIKLSFLKTA